MSGRLADLNQTTNALAEEVSPYLLQHAHNPVAWRPWGPAVWEKAKAENRPVFLSIGYSTCHWCHVMERESFEDEKTAEILNREFIPVKVDREERPDVDRVYMTAVQAMTGQGGWPLSVWLTPEGKPFYGGTYFPPHGAYGRPGFGEVLKQIASAWKERKGEVESWAEELSGRIRSLGEGGARGGEIRDAEKILHAASLELSEEYDRKHGGFGGAPKFPRPSQPLFLLRRSFFEKSERLLEICRHTGRAMAAGGIYDQVGDGFHRYAVDAADEWEKETGARDRAAQEAFLAKLEIPEAPPVLLGQGIVLAAGGIALLAAFLGASFLFHGILEFIRHRAWWKGTAWTLAGAAIVSVLGWASGLVLGSPEPFTDGGKGNAETVETIFWRQGGEKQDFPAELKVTDADLNAWFGKRLRFAPLKVTDIAVLVTEGWRLEMEDGTLLLDRTGRFWGRNFVLRHTMTFNRSEQGEDIYRIEATLGRLPLPTAGMQAGDGCGKVHT